MKNIFIESQSRHDFDLTVEKLSETILSGGWNISVTLDLQASLSKSGIEILPVKIIELCHPKLASQILLNNDTRLYSSMLPCKISIYRKEDRKTYVSILNTGILASHIGGNVEKVMIEAFRQAESFIHHVTEK